jgi:hypothetical protein
VNTPFRRHQLYVTLITGGATTVIAAAKTGYRVKVYAICLTGAGVIEEVSGGAPDFTGVLPTPCEIATNQPDFLVQGRNDEGLQYTGTGTGFITWAYEKYVVVSQ